MLLYEPYAETQLTHCPHCPARPHTFALHVHVLMGQPELLGWGAHHPPGLSLGGHPSSMRRRHCQPFLPSVVGSGAPCPLIILPATDFRAIGCQGVLRVPERSFACDRQPSRRPAARSPMLHRPPSHSAAIGPGAVPSLGLPTPAALEQRQQLGAAQAPSCGAEAFTVDPAALAGGQPRKHTQ